jgi:hypothetical protein
MIYGLRDMFDLAKLVSKYFKVKFGRDWVLIKFLSLFSCLGFIGKSSSTPFCFADQCMQYL